MRRKRSDEAKPTAFSDPKESKKHKYKKKLYPRTHFPSRPYKGAANNMLLSISIGSQGTHPETGRVAAR